MAKKKPAVDVNELASKVDKLTELVTQLVQNNANASKKTATPKEKKPSTPKKKGTPRKKGSVPPVQGTAKADEDIPGIHRPKKDSGYVTQPYKSEDGKQFCGAVPFAVGQHKNTFVDDRKIAAADSIKKNPKLGADPERLEPRVRPPAKKVKVTCVGCGRIETVSAVLVPSIKGEKMDYRCNGCCRG